MTIETFKDRFTNDNRTFNSLSPALKYSKSDALCRNLYPNRFFRGMLVSVYILRTSLMQTPILAPKINFKSLKMTGTPEPHVKLNSAKAPHFYRYS